MVKFNRILALLTVVVLAANCGKEQAVQPSTSLTYPSLTQISVDLSQPVGNAITARKSDVSLLRLHSNVYQTANQNDKIHYSIQFYPIPTIDQNKTHVSVDSEKIAFKMEFNANTGNLTVFQRLDARIVVQYPIGTATLRGNKLTINSLQFRNPNFRKYLKIPEESVFQKEYDSLKAQLSESEEKIANSQKDPSKTKEVLEAEKYLHKSNAEKWNQRMKELQEILLDFK